MATIKFYRTTGPYGCFSNFSKHPVSVSGVVWPTSEHYYQAKKFTSNVVQGAIRKSRTAAEAASMGRMGLPSYVGNEAWEKMRDGVMLEVLRLKFEQNQGARLTLLQTGSDVIVEDSPTDYYWGCGADGSGKNMLGKLLEQVRRELLEEEKS